MELLDWELGFSRPRVCQILKSGEPPQRHQNKSSQKCLGPKRPHKHKDLTFWFQGPIQGGYQKQWFVGSLCLCGLLRPHIHFYIYIYGSFEKSGAPVQTPSSRALILRTLTTWTPKFQNQPYVRMHMYQFAWAIVLGTSVQ